MSHPRAAPTGGDKMIRLLVLLRAGADGVAGLRDYESRVLPIVAAHGGRLLAAFRPRADASNEPVDEIHLVEFDDAAAFARYRADPRLAALAERRERAIARTTLYVSEEIVDYPSR